MSKSNNRLQLVNSLTHYFENLVANLTKTRAEHAVVALVFAVVGVVVAVVVDGVEVVPDDENWHETLET